MPVSEIRFLTLGQPATLTAFATAAGVLVSPRRFTGAELGALRGMAPDEVLDCIITFEAAAGLLHICIAPRWGDLSPGARDQFRNIATILAHQAIEHTIPEARLIFHEGKQNSPAHRSLIRAVGEMARKCRFYRHSLPWRDLPEEFCRVDMAWSGTRFIDPDFAGAIYPVLPALLRQAAESGGFVEPSSTVLIQTSPRPAARPQPPKKLS